MEKIIEIQNGRATGTIKIKSVSHHRNGVGGKPFYAALFEAIDSPLGDALAVFTEDEGECYVLNVEKLANGDIAFGSNSWRGDCYHGAMLQAIAPEEANDLDDLEQICLNLLAERQIKDAGQRNEEQYLEQIQDCLTSRGIKIESPYED